MTTSYDSSSDDELMRPSPRKRICHRNIGGGAAAAAAACESIVFGSPAGMPEPIVIRNPPAHLYPPRPSCRGPSRAVSSELASMRGEDGYFGGPAAEVAGPASLFANDAPPCPSTGPHGNGAEGGGAGGLSDLFNKCQPQQHFAGSAPPACLGAWATSLAPGLYLAQASHLCDALSCGLFLPGTDLELVDNKADLICALAEKVSSKGKELDIGTVEMYELRLGCDDLESGIQGRGMVGLLAGRETMLALTQAVERRPYIGAMLVRVRVRELASPSEVVEMQRLLE